MNQLPTHSSQLWSPQNVLASQGTFASRSTPPLSAGLRSAGLWFGRHLLELCLMLALLVGIGLPASWQAAAHAAPAAVTLSASGQNSGYYGPEVQLSWTQSGDGDFASYKLYRATHSNVTTADTLVETKNSASETSHYDYGLSAAPAPGTTYYYRVFVYDQNGAGTGSNEESATVVDTVPSAVTLSQPSAYYGSEVQLYWTRNSDYDLASYKVYRATHQGVTEADELVSTLNVGDAYGDPLSGYDSNAPKATPPGVTYYYRVFTIDAAGQSSGSNEESIVRLDSPPVAVTLAEPSLYSSEGSPAVHLAWNRSGEEDITSYQVYRATHQGVTGQDTLVTTISSDDATSNPVETYDAAPATPSPGSTYYYRVLVTDSASQSAWSNERSITMVDAPPTAVTLSAPQEYYGSEVSLTWTRSSDYDLASYKVYRATHTGVTEGDTLITTVSAGDVYGDTAYGSDSNAPATVAPGTTYYYRVFTVDNAGQSTGSNEESILRLDGAPSAVTLSAPSAYYENSVLLSWTRAYDYDLVSYKLYRATHTGVTEDDTLVATVNAGDVWGDTVESYDGLSGVTGTVYYRVFTIDGAGQSTGSNEVSYQAAVAPDAPGAVSFSQITDTSVQVTLPALPENAATLSLQQKLATQGDEAYATIAQGLGGGAFVDVAELTTDTTYSFRAVAVGAGGQTAGPGAEVTPGSSTEPEPTPTPTAAAEPTATPTAVPSSCGEGEYWDEASQSCQAEPIDCPEGLYWEEATQSCEIALPSCPEGEHWDEITQSCSLDTPESPCPEGEYWDETTQSCQADDPTCPEGEHWDDLTQSCQTDTPPCPEGEYWDETLQSCLSDSCPEGQYWDGTTKSCQVDTPPSCPSGESWDAGTESCVVDAPTCPAGEQWDEVAQECVSSFCGTNEYWDDSTQSCQPDPCPDGTLWNELTERCEVAVCPSGEYWDGETQQCVLSPCPEGEFWVEELQSCMQICKPYEYWDEETLSCQVDTQRCPPGEEWHEETQSCGPDQCPEGEHWDVVTQSCQKDYGEIPTPTPTVIVCDQPSCCPEGTHWDADCGGIGEGGCVPDATPTPTPTATPCDQPSCCPEGTHWDASCGGTGEGGCVPDVPLCPEGEHWDDLTQSCQPGSEPEGEPFAPLEDPLGNPLSPQGEPFAPLGDPFAPAAPEGDCTGISSPGIDTESIHTNNLSFSFSWSAVEGASHYGIFREGQATPLATVPATVPETQGKQYTYSGSEPTADTYSYRVRAYKDCAGYSIDTNSNQARVQLTTATPGNTPTPTPTQPPGTVGGMNLLVTAGNGRVELLWNKVSNATSYLVWRSLPDNENPTVVAGTVLANPTVATVAGLQNGKTYYFKVEPFANGTSLGYSNIVHAMPYAIVTPAPTTRPAPQLGLFAYPGQQSGPPPSPVPTVTGSGVMRLGIIIGLNQGDTLSSSSSNKVGDNEKHIVLRIAEGSRTSSPSTLTHYRDEVVDLTSKTGWMIDDGSGWRTSGVAPSSGPAQNKVRFMYQFDWDTTRSWTNENAPPGLLGNDGPYMFRLVDEVRWTWDTSPYATATSDRRPNGIEVDVRNFGPPTPTPTAPAETIPPTITIDVPSPASSVPGTWLRGLTSIEGHASDNAGTLREVQVSIKRETNSGTKWWYNLKWRAGESPFANAHPDGQGLWKQAASLPTGADLPPGSYLIKATAIDRSGNKAYADVTVKIDNVPPQFTITEPGALVYNRLSGVKGMWTEANSGLADQMRVLLTRKTSGGSFEAWNGNAQPPAWVPVGNADFGSHGVNTSTWPSLSAHPTYFDWRLDDGEVAKLPPASQLSSGQYRVAVQGKDKAGNAGQTSKLFTLAADTTAPSVTVTSPADKAVIYTRGASGVLSQIAGTVTETGSALAPTNPVKVWLCRTVNGTTKQKWNSNLSSWQAWDGRTWDQDLYSNATVTGTGTQRMWKVEGNLPYYSQFSPGVYQVRATAEDAAGNIGETVSSFKVESDLTGPTLNILTPINGSIAVRLPQVSGTATDGGSGIDRVEVTLYQQTSSGAYQVWNGSRWNSTTQTTGAAWVAHSTTVTPGENDVTWSRTADWPPVGQLLAREYKVRARAFDRAGNSSTYAMATIKVQRIAEVQAIPKMQYSLNNGTTWQDVPRANQAGYPLTLIQHAPVTFRVTRGNTGWDWPSGKPLWSGDGGVAARRGESVPARFSSLSASATDLKSVTAECGNEARAWIKVVLPARQPDLLIRKKSESDYIGDNVYGSLQGQTKTLRVPPASKAIFLVKVQNDGSTTEALRITASPSDHGWSARYFDAVENGNEITVAATGDGWMTPQLSTGQSREIRIELTAPGVVSSAEYRNLECLLTATSVADGTKTDQVRALASVGSNDVLRVRRKGSSNAFGPLATIAAGSKNTNEHRADIEIVVLDGDGNPMPGVIVPESALVIDPAADGLGLGSPALDSQAPQLDSAYDFSVSLNHTTVNGQDLGTITDAQGVIRGTVRSSNRIKTFSLKLNRGPRVVASPSVTIKQVWANRRTWNFPGFFKVDNPVAITYSPGFIGEEDNAAALPTPITTHNVQFKVAAVEVLLDGELKFYGIEGFDKDAAGLTGLGITVEPYPGGLDELASIVSSSASQGNYTANLKVESLSTGTVERVWLMAQNKTVWKE